MNCRSVLLAAALMMIPAAVPRPLWIDDTSSPSSFVCRKSTVSPAAVARATAGSRSTWASAARPAEPGPRETGARLGNVAQQVRQFDRGLHFHLVEHARAVHLHCSHADVELGRTGGEVGFDYPRVHLLLGDRVAADGKPVSPTEDNFANAAKGIDWSKSFAQDLTNQKGENAWPITSTTFILVHKATNKPEQTAEVLKFFDWAFSATGDKSAADLEYVPLPASVKDLVRKQWAGLTDGAGKAISYK